MDARIDYKQLLMAIGDGVVVADADGTIVEVQHPVRGSYFTIGSPIKFSDLKPEVTASPLLGQHTDEVLEELGYTSQQIKAMHEAKAI